jgi:sterol desaturase/sphingolipid hydroxylase (fatty acid hydroxylase superfamily)
MTPDVLEWLGIFASFAILNALRYFVICGGSYYCLWIRNRDFTLPRRIQEPDFNSADIRRDIFNSLKTSLIFSFIISIPFAPSLRSHFKIYIRLFDHGAFWLLVSLPVMIILHDAFSYWQHRFMHHPIIFKSVHWVHHQTANPSPFSAYSFHAFEPIFQFIWIIPVMFLIPFHIAVLVAFGAISLACNVIGHLGAEFYPRGWATHPIMKWLNGSTNHNRHHVILDCNYGLYFNWWDVWMNTLKPSSPSQSDQ